MQKLFQSSFVPNRFKFHLQILTNLLKNKFLSQKRDLLKIELTVFEFKLPFDLGIFKILKNI